MTLQLTVTADNPQELTSILAALGNHTMVVSAPATTNKKAAPKETPKIEQAAGQTDTTTNTTTAPAGQALEMTIEAVRKVINDKTEKGTDREVIIKLLNDEFKVTRLTELPADQRAAFVEKINAL